MNMRIEDLEPSEREWLAQPGNPSGSYLKERSSCPSARLIRAAQMEALPEALHAAVTTHIAGCSACRRLQADLESLPPPADVTREENRRILSRVRRAVQAERAKMAVPRRTLSWWAALVTALACCSILVFWQIRRTALEPALSERPVSARKTPPAGIPDALKLEKPEVKLTFAVLTWRGNSESGQKFLSDIAPALDAYRADRFAEAAGRFDALSPRYPESVEVFFYLGVSRLFLGDNEAAVNALEKAAGLADSSFAADVSWYLGLACHRAGRIVDARVRFASLCSGKSTYASRACAAVAELDRSIPPK